MLDSTMAVADLEQNENTVERSDHDLARRGQRLRSVQEKSQPEPVE
jgi:hypothetical protein